jgi:16S rRNA (uracil1498-N3)-methyltransferase
LVQAATQQSGRGELMTIAEPRTLEQTLAEFKDTPRAAGIFPYEGESPQHLDDALARIKTAGPDQVWAFVGSEGGFSVREVELFGAHHLPATSMGEQILRAETACLALVSVIKYELGSLR